MINLLDSIKEFWDWFWYYRHGKVKYYVLDFGDTYYVSASNGKVASHNNYGSTPEMAKEIALFKLNIGVEKYNNDTDRRF